MSLVKSKRELELFNYYKKYLKYPELIDDVVIKAYRDDIRKLKRSK